MSYRSYYAPVKEVADGELCESPLLLAARAGRTP